MSRMSVALTLVVMALASPAALATPPAASSEPTASAAAMSIMSRPCFGAPARNPFGRCVDPSLRLTVLPAPDDAALEPNAPCEPQAQGSLVNPCAFGVTGSSRPATTALIGDSHASHWRAAVDVVARRAGAHAVSITRTGCPFSMAQVVIPSRRDAATCRSWNHAVLAWLRHHPEVTTIFLSQRANARYVALAGAASNFDTAVRGDVALYRALPATVTSVVVIRRRAAELGRCRGLRAAGLRPRAARRPALRPSACQGAAARPRRHGGPAPAGALPRTRHDVFFCGGALCYPVVGGALVHKDVDHITSVFARTLGPFMVSKVAMILKGARAGAPAAGV